MNQLSSSDFSESRSKYLKAALWEKNKNIIALLMEFFPTIFK